MENILAFECVKERDIDLLLLEEFNVNMDFCKFFVEKVTGEKCNIINAKAFHSVFDAQLGESDLLLWFETKNVKNILLIENKIDAIAQNEQANRYLLRAEKLISKENSQYNNVFNCIIAPQHYLDSNEEAKLYQSQISYEIVEIFFLDQNTKRSKYKASLMQLAITQERRGYLAIKDNIVTEFWHKYWTALKLEIPTARMKQPVCVPVNSDWPIISFDWFPKNCFIYHKFSSGFIDFQTNFSQEEAQGLLIKFKNKNMRIAKTGKALSLRLTVPALNKARPIEEQLTAVSLGILAIQAFENSVLK